MARYVRHKGHSLTLVPDEFCVIDLETTGLHPQYDDIIEMSAIKYQKWEPVDTFEALVQLPLDGYRDAIPSFITDLTGISNDDLMHGKPLGQALANYRSFIGDDVVVGHNVNFDLNFLYDDSLKLFNATFSNDFVDTMRLARKLFPELSHHRLKDICEFLSVDNPRAHQSWADCQATFDCLVKLYQYGSSKYGSLDAFNKALKPKYRIPDYAKFRAKDIKVTDVTKANPLNMLYKRHVCFTGALSKFTRHDAAQIVVNIGGFVDNGVTKKTNYLVLGNNDYCYTIKGGKSSKQRKAERYVAQGQDLQIIPEDIFYALIKGSY